MHIKDANHWAFFLVTGALLGFVVYMTFLAQRPYYVLLDTPESYYYFNSRAILESLTPDTVTHPGTPIYYLGSLLLLAVGTAPEKTQLFLDIGHLVAALATIGALFVFTRNVLKGTPFSVSLLALSSIAIWPPTATYLDHWSAESFLPAATLVTAAAYWRAIQTRGTSSRTRLAVGLGVGAAIALKAAFLPVALMIFASLVVHELRIKYQLSPSGDSWSGLRRIGVTGLGVVASFVVLTWPTLPQMHFVLSKSVSRSVPIRTPSMTAWEPLGEFLSTTPMFLPVALAASAVVALWTMRKIRPLAGTEAEDASGLDRTAAITFVGAALVGFVYAVWLTVPSFDPSNPTDPGMRLKNLTPLALSIVIAIPLLYHMLSARHRQLVAGRPGSSAVVGLAILMMLVGFSQYGAFRSDIYGALERTILAREAGLESFVSAQERVAFAGGVSYDWGAFGFHLDGNHSYTADRFDEELLSMFSRYMLVRMDRVEQIAYESCGLETNAPVNSRGVGVIRGPLQDWFSRWQNAVPLPVRDDQLITGENSGPPDAVVYRAPLVAGGDAALRCALEARFGPFDSTEISLAGEDWMLARPRPSR